MGDSKVRKVFYLLMCVNGFIRVEEDGPILGQNEDYVCTGNEDWALDGFAGYRNLNYYYFEAEGKSWWRTREAADKALSKLLAERKLEVKEKRYVGKFN